MNKVDCDIDHSSLKIRRSGDLKTELSQFYLCKAA